jgi:hypothetical protein
VARQPLSSRGRAQRFFYGQWGKECGGRGGGVGDIHVEGKEGEGKNGRRVVGTGLEPAGMHEVQVAAWLHHVASMRQGRRPLTSGPLLQCGW